MKFVVREAQGRECAVESHSDIHYNVYSISESQISESRFLPPVRGRVWGVGWGSRLMAGASTAFFPSFLVGGLGALFVVAWTLKDLRKPALNP